MRKWLFKTLFGDEYRAGQSVRRHADALGFRLTELEAELKAKQPKPARFKLEGGMEQAQIAELLAGQRGLGAIKAVEALLANKVIELSDKATDAPHGAYATAEGAVPAFGHDERLHHAGGANAAAELLAELQELVAPRDQEAKKEATS